MGRRLSELCVDGTGGESGRKSAARSFQWPPLSTSHMAKQSRLPLYSKGSKEITYKMNNNFEVILTGMNWFWGWLTCISFFVALCLVCGTIAILLGMLGDWIDNKYPCKYPHEESTEKKGEIK